MEQSAQYLQPLVGYLKAKDRLRQGETVAAAEAIEEVFGSDSNAFLRQNVDIALDETTLAGLVLLDGIFGEMKWIQRKTATPRRHQS